MKFLSIEKVLEKANGPTGLQEALWRTGQPFPSYQRLANWKTRKRIPGAWTGAIVWALACKGVNPLKLLSDTQE